MGDNRIRGLQRTESLTSSKDVIRIEFLFFFSSRRRHTRLQGDWSSDVCSSDLWVRKQTNAHSGLQAPVPADRLPVDRKSTRLNSSHLVISYAVFCLKKKKKKKNFTTL